MVAVAARPLLAEIAGLKVQVKLLEKTDFLGLALAAAIGAGIGFALGAIAVR